MSILKSYKVLIISIIVSSLCSCELINPPEDIPAYISINSFDLDPETGDNPIINEKTKPHDINGVWLNIDGNIQGSYELPVTFPVLAEMIAEGECKFAGPIRSALRAQRIGDMVEIDGDIETSVYLPCSRCLQSFETLLKSHFTLTFMQRVADIIEDAEPQEVELNAEAQMVLFLIDEINQIGE